MLTTLSRVRSICRPADRHGSRLGSFGLVDSRVTDLEALLTHAARALTRDPGRVSQGTPARATRGAESTDLDRTRSPRHAVSELAKLITESGVRTAHRRHFGWMNPAAHPAGSVADLLVSGLNPQLAARALSPGPIAAEERLVRELATRLGFPADVEGHFTSGGSEANASALVCALANGVPNFSEHGLSAGARPIVYASVEAHNSLDKAARAHGLGREGLRRVPVDAERRMDLGALADTIASDRDAGHRPLMLVSTAGTTNVGAVDPLEEASELARAEGLWHHVDAAWGGQLALSGQASTLRGLEHADSAAFDPHKALGAPMGTGMLFVRPGVLALAFDTQPEYGPDSLAPDPYKRSLMWSRFIGARLWLPLLLEGWPRLEARVRDRLALGPVLRDAVSRAGFGRVGPKSVLPVVCFRDRDRDDAGQLAIARAVAQTGEAWVATTRVDGQTCLRACVCSDETDRDDIARLGALLSAART